MHACIGEGNGNPFQYSCLENPRDRGAWWAAIYVVAQSWTQLKWLSSSSSVIQGTTFNILQSPMLFTRNTRLWINYIKKGGGGGQQKGKCGVQKSVLKAYVGGRCGLRGRVPSSQERWGLRIHCWATSAMSHPYLNPQHRTQSAVGMEVLSVVCITRPLANAAPEVIWSGVEWMNYTTGIILSIQCFDI